MTCKTHPDAPHGFDRNASHSQDRYVCECESWEPPEQTKPMGVSCPRCGKTGLQPDSIHTCTPRALVPDGWKLVPVEPTPEMKTAGIAVEVYPESKPEIGALTWAEVKAIYSAMLAAAPQPAGEPVASAVQTVIEAMQADPDYAWGWHCNIAMAFVDAGGSHYTANQGAARFMRMLANVEPAHELPAAPQPHPDDTALLRQALEATAYWLEHGETPGAHDMIQRTHDALQERLIPLGVGKGVGKREHITDGSPCWCNPETTYTDPDTGVSVIVHKEPQ